MVRHNSETPLPRSAGLTARCSVHAVADGSTRVRPHAAAPLKKLDECVIEKEYVRKCRREAVIRDLEIREPGRWPGLL
jgi:hypothetical protein